MEKQGNILMKKYEIGRLLGKGTFAKVYYGRNLETGQGVAIKVIDKEKVLRVGLMNQTKREISVMGMIKHQNVVQLYEVLATKTKIHFAMEHVKGGELFQKVSKGRLDENEARKYFQQLISAVSFCHERGVYHRDLKPENLLLDEFENLKVTDFGLSALSESKRQDGLLHTACGTPAYVAPEVISRKGYDGAKADIWSCGVILYVLLAGYLPFYDSNVMEMYKKISKAQFKFPNWFPTDAKRLLSRILDPNPKTRISISRIMNHHWFKKGLNLKDSLPKAGESNGSPHLEPLDCDTFDGLQTKSNLAKPTNLNAFDIISLSSGLDLSSLFVSNDQKDEFQFTSTKSALEIVSKLDNVASPLRLKVVKKDEQSMRLERSNECMNGNFSIDVCVYEIADSYNLVEVKKSSGDSFEYQRLMRELRTDIKDIVWAWRGDHQQPD